MFDYLMKPELERQHLNTQTMQTESPRNQHVKKSSTHDRVSFSPIKLEDPHPSPGVNLTGVPRRIRDRCADVYNTHKKWQKVKLQGARLIKKIANRRGESLKETDLFELSDNLYKVVDDLEILVATFKAVSVNFGSLVGMSELKLTFEPTCSDRAPFVSLTLRDYAAMTRDVEAAYREELSFKKDLVRRIPCQTSAGVFTFASMCWMFDMHIDERVDALILALVAECGFK